MYTLDDLQKKVKRRIRQLAATTSSAAEAERGNLLSNTAINDAINGGRKQLMVSVKDAELWGKTTTTVTTLSNTQDYDIGTDVLKILRVLYDVTVASVGGAYEDKATHVAGNTSVSGFSGLVSSAYANGSIFCISSGVFYSGMISTNDATTVTLSNGSSIPALSDEPVFLRALPSGARNANTYEASDLMSAVMEEAAIRDPLNAPSATNPKYRMTKSKFRLVVSTDGSVTAGKYVEVEYLKELSDLSGTTDQTGLPMTMDEMVVDWAVYLTCLMPMPQVAQLAYNEFYRKAQIINGRK